VYLKSLSLKGFKSFADKVQVSLEPGITAVVGPNGSGKSNISDAVLWVLGERSARNLRGQAMEDIIFSGSAARKAVSVAEVELVLDNSDGTLPVDFDEVSIARRMYRSGESEYLINGVVARRMDVLDILHDTGLGTGTHSIISQGSLDSILQSRPEDRRALIEEAAGVLKHKQRKEKSARKLAAMDNHLARVRDVTAEVSRQLGPLERKAKRAQAYKQVSGELSELKLKLAVDDLRRLQREWDKVIAAESELAAEIEKKRGEVSQAERKVNDIQELIRRESADAGDLARKQRRASAIAERMDSTEMLVRERKRQALSYEADMQVALEGARAKRATAQLELEQATAQLSQAKSESESINAQVEALSKERFQAAERRRAVEAKIEQATVELRKLERDAEANARKLSNLRETLSNGLAHEKLVEARQVEIGRDLARAQEERDAADKALAQAKDVLAQCEKTDADARTSLGLAFDERERARIESDAAQEKVRVVESEIKALKAAQRATTAEDPALVWLIDHAAEFGSDIAPVSQALGAPADIESLVERLLGADLYALSVRDSGAARQIAKALLDGARVGDVALVLRDDVAVQAPARSAKAGTALVDLLSFSQAHARIVEALLGDIVVCETRAQAFDGHESDKQGLRFVSKDGCVVYPNGKVVVYGARPQENEGVLARERRLAQLEDSLSEAYDQAAKCVDAAASADETYRSRQQDSLHASEALANQKGVVSAAQTEQARAAEKLTAIIRESKEIEDQLETAHKTVGDLRPDVEATEALIAEIEKQRASCQAEQDRLSQDVVPLRSEAGKLSEKLADAKLSAATLAERTVYAERIVTSRQREIESVEHDVAEARRTIALKKASCTRTDPLLDSIAALQEALHARLRILDEAILASETNTNSVHADAIQAREDARVAHTAFDEANTRMTQVRVDMGRLEVQVEAAVNVVVRDCGTPLDRIDQIPELDDRRQAEDDAFKLERRIKNMGAINPDAAEEYEKLKERYDFLAGQLDDMENARKSLARIVRIIDARMKDDFARTFDQVNKNFGDIFATLFPGGSAKLTLVDPDDIENTGVEVTAQPRGKRITKMMLMSGGEKSLTALALLFAVYRIRTTPFYILDEVEAALDDTNLRRLIGYIDSLRNETQLIMITHQRRTMETADVLFGVSMQSDGVTKVISQKLERALEQAE